MMVEPSPSALVTLGCLFWLTLLTGFVGLGMHLRGFDRQMAGLYVALFNWLQGPPAMAPALFAGLAAIGLSRQACHECCARHTERASGA